jgi:hypothetical protein
MVIGGYSCDRARVHDRGHGHGGDVPRASVLSHVNVNASVHGCVLRDRVQHVHGDRNMPYRLN